MQIKNILNEFEADWAAMPSVEKEKLSEIKNKTFIICGHNIVRCFCYALLYLNETKNLNTKVILVGSSKECMSDYYSELLLRNDFEFIDFNSINEIKNADYILHSGLCSEEISQNTEIFKDEISSAKFVSALASRLNAKSVLLSDSRVFGTPKPHRIYSEKEYSEAYFVSESDFSSQLLRTIEMLWNCQNKSGDFPLTILRTGIVLGASANLASPLDEAFSKIANNEDCAVPEFSGKRSFVYISDVFRAIIYAFTSLESGNIYNVTGINSTVSSAMISAVLKDIYGDTVSIKIGRKKNIDGCPINSNKIADCGCEPKINLETAFEMCVMSKMNNSKAMSLPYSHDGRLTSIQNILLAYLLEVDRICRKHNIKYFLGGGTLLGAIRHHGFIPWDDDADIMMLRNDYDKFCAIAASEMPSSMTFQTNENDKNCFYEFAKFRLNGTFFATEFAKEHKNMNNGLAFDIFCHDKTANSRLGQKIHLGLTLFTRALVFNKWNNRKADNGSRIQSAFTNLCIKLFPIRFSLWLENKTLKFFKNKKHAKYLYDGMGRNVYNGSFPIEYLDEVIYVDFEGHKLPVPKEYDKYLTFLYGDYMELAPLSTRLGCHEIRICDLGEYDGFEINKNSIGN